MQSLSSGDLKTKLQKVWGKKVSDYKEEYSTTNSTKWRWKIPTNYDLNPQELTEYTNLITSRKIKQNQKEDQLIWSAANNGKYKVKVGYDIICNSQEREAMEIPTQLCWDPAGLPKAGFFLWLAVQNRILTSDRLRRFGIAGPTRCPLCKAECEDMNHLLYECSYSRNCWEWLVRNLDWSSPFPRVFKTFIMNWPHNICKGIYSKIWNISPAIIAWEIWKERNRRIFKNTEMEINSLITKIEISILETMNSYLRKSRFIEGSFSLWDERIKKLWPRLINPPLTYFKTDKEARKNCRWSPPPKGWTKLNFDGAARGNPGVAGIGCIINDESGKWLAKLAKPINPTTNNLAEFAALEEGLQVCHYLGISNLIIEGDSQIILNALRKRDTPNWILNSRLKEALSLLDKFAEIRIYHIYREGNSKADKLANLGADGLTLSSFRS